MNEGTPIWQTDYDSVGFYTVAVAMDLRLDVTGASFSVTGFSFTSGGNAHFVTLSVNPNNGLVKARSYSDNGAGAISHPVGILSDSSKESYVAGNGMDTDIVTARYDTLLLTHLFRGEPFRFLGSVDFAFLFFWARGKIYSSVLDD